MIDDPEMIAVEAPRLRFYRLFESARKPVLADESAHGLLPVRAYRFCEPARKASSIGWYVFPAYDVWLTFDGTTIFARLSRSDPFEPLQDKVLTTDAQAFDAACPTAMNGHCPPFLGASESGILNISTGLAVRTNEDWGVLVRRPPNVPQKNLFEFFEGFIETSKWFGPLFINVRMLKTDQEIHLAKDWPIAFIQPLPSQLVKLKLAGCDEYVSSLSDLTDDDWSDLSDTLVGRLGPDRVLAKYARTMRKT